MSSTAATESPGSWSSPAFRRLRSGISFILSHHTTAEDAGRIAKAAGVKLLVLSHLVPADDPAVTDEMWIDAARKHFDGEVVVGKDLLKL
jgi:ribonuclease BN (tRNA processing enzyme)